MPSDSDLRRRFQEGTQPRGEIDLEQRRVDYWSQNRFGLPVSVHKVRTFEDVGGATKVSEVVHGEAPIGVHLLVRRTARAAHRQHMDSYHLLF